MLSGKEVSISCGGYSFTVICGCHINGAYAAFMNWGFSVELSSYSVPNADSIAEKLAAYSEFAAPEFRRAVANALSETITPLLSYED